MQVIHLNLGPNKAGIADLRAQLLNPDGTNNGTSISSGFYEIAQGNYLFQYSGTDGFRGAIKFYSNASPSVILAMGAINPEDGENLDVKVSTRLPTSSYVAPDNATIASIASSISSLPGNIWAYLVSNIVTTNSIGKRIVDFLDAKVSGITSTVAKQTNIRTAASNITMQRSSSVDITVTGLIIPSDWTKIVLTVKKHLSYSDSKSTLQLKISNPSSGDDGIQILNGSVYDNNEYGYLTIDQPDGEILIHIDDVAAQLLNGDVYKYDFKFYTSTASTATNPAEWSITEIVTNEV